MNDSPHILLVDDRRDIREPLKQYLEPHGYRVTLAQDAKEARSLLNLHQFKLFILDIMMPGEDGLSLSRHIQTQNRAPIIFLSALGEETDRIVGLEMGADDYLIKPFNPRELLARIKSVLRRTYASVPLTETDEVVSWQFANWQLASNTRELSQNNGTKVPLSSGEYAMLVVMLNRPNRVLNREQLLDLSQGREAEVFDRAVDNQVSRLRKKLDQFSDKDGQIIQTVWGTGYKFVAEVTKYR